MDKELLQRGMTTALRWWKSMYASTGELKKEGIQAAPTAWKAELKRAESIDAVLLSQGFRSLWLSLSKEITEGHEKQVSQDMLCWAVVAGALVSVSENHAESFAKLAGRKGDGDKPVVSEMRFAQLQQAQTPEEFLRRIRRILKQLNGKVSVAQLAKDSCNWYQELTSNYPRQADKRIAVRWAMDYYQAN
ncbi:type I-E CRISPR-associated protein Cse2/CasB [uncultured Alteromonas sp.]|jgi:CRISPR system Cascade subunit CasB|uniref:type I-E CRISPR-associated protein Cse2/CasB n=1 Tax=uncultured Alteromonas sp. TaxID=179113 RepID=UPI0025F3E64A|nr:type I-E CRISPR-associated protein Cse2/CasB [uncultured Alteromonas sp.]